MPELWEMAATELAALVQAGKAPRVRRQLPACRPTRAARLRRCGGRLWDAEHTTAPGRAHGVNGPTDTPGQTMSVAVRGWIIVSAP